jgi:glycosyltransferase involved in cell wall biosynthesis
VNAAPSGAEARDDPFRGRDVVCFGHDWTGDPLSKTHLMRLLAREGRVLWINSIGYRTPTVSTRDLRRAIAKVRAARQALREVEPNLFVLSPLAVPLHGAGWARTLNRALLGWQIARAMRRLRFTRPLSFVYNPAAAVVARTIGASRTIYHCVDEFTAFSGVGPELAELETTLLREADLVIVSSERLLQAKAAHNPRTVLVRHGVAYEHFRTALLPATAVPAEIAALPRPVIGYFGLMGADWVDVPLLVGIARRFAHGSLVLIGAETTDLGALRTCPNVHRLGRRDFATLPGFCKGFDAAILPFPINEVTLASNPLKVREYLAAGLPVVATRIPEAAVSSHVRLADTPQEFLAHLEEVLRSEPGPRVERSATMAGESWEARLEEIRRAVQDLPT